MSRSCGRCSWKCGGLVPDFRSGNLSNEVSIRSFSTELHRQSSCDQFHLHGIPEEATSPRHIGGISTADISREGEQVSPVDVKPSCTWIDEERDSNLQANAARQSDPGEIQNLVVGSEGGCCGLKRFMLIEIISPSDLDVGSEELKMGSPVDLDVDVSPTYQEEHANGIHEATAPGTSQPGAREDMSIISRKPGGKLYSKISMVKSEVLVAGSQVDCNGLKRCMPIDIVNLSELQAVSEELEMGSPVNSDVDVLPTYEEEQGTDILEATATGESFQVGDGQATSIISREPGGHQAAKIEIQAARSNVCMDVSRWTQQLRWLHWHADQVHRLRFHHLGGGFTRHHQVLSVHNLNCVILKPAFQADGVKIIKNLRGHHNALHCAVFYGMGQSVIMGSSDQLGTFQAADSGLCLCSCRGHEGLLPSGVPVCVLQGCQHLLLSGVAAPRKPLSWDHMKDELSLPVRLRNLWFSHDSIPTFSRDGTVIIWMLQSLNPNVRVGPWRRRAYHVRVPYEASLRGEAKVADRHCGPSPKNTADPGTFAGYGESSRLTIVDTVLCTGSAMMKSDILDVGRLVDCNGSMNSTSEVCPTEVETREEEYGEKRFVDVEAASTCLEQQEKCILEGTCDGTSEARNRDDLVGCPSSEVVKTYTRRRKQSSPTETATEGPGALGGKAHASNEEGLPKPMDVGHEEAKNEDALPPKEIKCYVRRRQCQTGLHNLADAATQCQAQPPGLVAKEKGRVEGSSRKVCTEMQASRYNKTDVQENNAEGSTIEDGFTRSDYQPSWLPEGWALETKVQDGGTAAGRKDKFYHEQKSGHRFRSRNDVMQYLDSVNSVQWQVKPGQWSVKTPIQKNEKNADHLASGRPSGVQSAPAKLFPSIQASSVHPTGASGTDVSNPHITWAHVSGPNGPIWPPWGGSMDPGQENQSEVENQGTVLKAPVVSEGTLKAPSLSPSQKVHSTTTGSVPRVETTSGQRELENRGKLIFRLKRKHPDQDAGKGRSKRRMYEVVHREKTSKASSSTSTLNEQEKKVVSGEGMGQEVLCGPLLMQVQGEKQPPIKKQPVPKAATVDLPVEQSMASITKNLSGKPLARSAPSEGVSAEQPPFKKPRVENIPTADWNGDSNSLQPGPSQQESFTALGIPATASASGLQHMAPFGANHTHVFMHHTESSIPVSWQYPFSSQPTTQAATSVLNLSPFPSSLHPSDSGPHVSAQVPAVFGTYPTLGSVPVPTLKHFSNPSRHLNITSSFDCCAGSGVGDTARDAAIVAKSMDGLCQPHKTTAHKSLTKNEHNNLLEVLGRYLCQVGLVQQPKIPCCSPGKVTGAVELPKSLWDIRKL